MDLRDLGIWGFGDIGIKEHRNIGFLEVFKVFRVFRVFKGFLRVFQGF